MIRESHRSKVRRAALARRFVALDALEGRALLSDGIVGPLPFQAAALVAPAAPTMTLTLTLTSTSTPTPTPASITGFVVDEVTTDWSLRGGVVGTVSGQPTAGVNPPAPPPAPAPAPAPVPAPAPKQPTFKTVEEAAADWGKKYNGASIKENQEYGSTIYKNADGTYSYTPPAKGGVDGVTPSQPTGGETVVADIHSHGAYDPKYDSNNFSDTDKKDNDKQKIPGYLASPNGQLQKYDPANQKVTVVNSDLPSDKNDPDRKNKIDP